MSYLRTAVLLAALTALFVGVGYLIGGQPACSSPCRRGRHEPLQLLELGQDGAVDVPRAGGRRAHRARPRTRMVASSRRAPASRCRASIIIENRSRTPSPPAAIPQHAAVAVTTGLLNMLDRDEIAGVIAHELAHIKNRDTLTMTITATIAGAISILANFALFFGGNRDRHTARHHRDDRDGDPRPPGRDAGADGDQPHARIRGRPGRREDRAIRPRWPRRSTRSTTRAADREPDRRAQPRHRAHVHHQPAHRRTAPTTCSPPTLTANRIAALQQLAAEMGQGFGGFGGGAAPRQSVPAAGGASPWGTRRGSRGLMKSPTLSAGFFHAGLSATLRIRGGGGFTPSSTGYAGLRRCRS